MLVVGKGGAVKDWSKLPMNNTRKLQTWGGGVKNPEKMPTLFMDGTISSETPHCRKIMEIFESKYVTKFPPTVLELNPFVMTKNFYWLGV